jgi:hypothetical protein
LTVRPEREGEPPLPRDIRELKLQKQPRSAIEMAAVTAYYLSKLAPLEIRKDFITSADITKYFGQAGFLLPTEPRFTLPNGKNAGYFDSLGGGKYSLNPVGQNLVTHGLPKKTGAGATTPRIRKRKPRGKGPKQVSRKSRR